MACKGGSIDDFPERYDVLTILGLLKKETYLEVTCSFSYSENHSYLNFSDLEDSAKRIRDNRKEWFSSPKGTDLMETLELILSIVNEGDGMVEMIHDKVASSVDSSLAMVSNECKPFLRRVMNLHVSNVLKLTQSRECILKHDDNQINELLEELLFNEAEIDNISGGGRIEYLSLAISNLRELQRKLVKIRQLQRALEELRIRGERQYNTILLTS